MMFTRSQRNKLLQQGVQIEFLNYDRKPVIKTKLKCDANHTVSKLHQSPFIALNNNDKNISDNMGVIVEIKEVEDCVVEPNYRSVDDNESIETGYSSASESSAKDVKVIPKQILNYNLLRKPDKGTLSKISYRDINILSPTQPFISSTILSNAEAPKKLKSIETSTRSNSELPAVLLNNHHSSKNYHLLDKSVHTLKEPVLNLAEQPWEHTLDTTKPKVKVLEILFLPPGTIDPFCPIDIYNKPLDLSLNRPVNYSKPLDLSIHSKDQAIDLSFKRPVNYNEPLDLSIHLKNPAIKNQPKDELVATPQDSYVDEVLFLDTSCPSFNSINAESERLKDCAPPLLPVSTPEIHQNTVFYEDEELHYNLVFKPSIGTCAFSENKDIRRRVYEILNYPCLRYFENYPCFRIPCKFNHNLVEADDIHLILKSEPIIIIQKCYALVNQFNSLFHKYFQTFCIIFGEKQMIEFLISMINHCEWPKRPVSFYRHIIQGFKLCKLDDTTCFIHLIENSTLKSPKSCNILIWIMVDLGVVLKFRYKLGEYLRRTGFYISAPNLTRLLGVCSRTKNHELIRIIYEAVESYPDKVKERLHWSVRPYYIRLENSISKSVKKERNLIRN